jgi:hypothetical protein
MRTVRLAKLFDHKHGLTGLLKEAAPPKEIFERAKEDILTNYQNWVMGKHRALKHLAEQGEPHAKSIYVVYNDLVANIDSYSPMQAFNRVNKILGLISEMKANPKGYRESIHGSVEVKRESDKNYRELLKRSFETNLQRISFGLEKVAKVLRAFVPEAEMLGGAVEPQRAELSKDKLLRFMHTPAAQRYGLDSLDTMAQVLAYPESKARLTTLINAIDRGHVPADGPEVMKETAAIKAWLDTKKTNVSALEQEPGTPEAPFEEEDEE